MIKIYYFIEIDMKFKYKNTDFDYNSVEKSIN